MSNFSLYKRPPVLASGVYLPALRLSLVKGLQIIACVFLFVAIRASFAAAENGDTLRSIARPRVCVGFDPITGSWGPGETPLTGIANCPDDYAIMGTPRGQPQPLPPEQVSINRAACCPLPRGLLEREQTFAAMACPPDSVATGYVVTNYQSITGIRPAELLRCTHLDKRFMLGEPKSAISFGMTPSGIPALVFGIPEFELARGQLPAALRYGVSRNTKVKWELSGCVGSPPGSLLVAKLNSGCDGLQFSEVVFRGLEGDPPKGTPVQTLPSCKAIDNPYSTEPKCIAEQE